MNRDNMGHIEGKGHTTKHYYRVFEPATHAVGKTTDNGHRTQGGQQEKQTGWVFGDIHKIKYGGYSAQ